jgi:hypothetical protein
VDNHLRHRFQNEAIVMPVNKSGKKNRGQQGMGYQNIGKTGQTR